MWRDPRAFCPGCRSQLITKDHTPESRCRNCGGFVEVIKCSGHCKLQFKICHICEEADELPKYRKSGHWEKQPRNDGNSKKEEETRLVSSGSLERKQIIWILVAVLVSLGLCYYIHVWYQSPSNSLDEKFKKLRKAFPSQTNHTWSHLFSVLDQEKPSVKSITLLHGDDKRTSDCLTKELVSMLNESINMEDVIFSTANFVGMDSGHVLVHHLEVVKAFRVLVTDLTKIPGKIAEIFQFLCDEFSLGIKPSLFIFTLKFNENREMPGTKPLERAGKILQESWKDLPEHIIHPLLTRVLRNVVEIKPEQGGC